MVIKGSESKTLPLNWSRFAMYLTEMDEEEVAIESMALFVRNDRACNACDTLCGPTFRLRITLSYAPGASSLNIL